MRQLIQLFISVLLVTITTAVSAAQVTIICPSHTAVKIKNGTATGYASRSDSELPIFLRGDTASTRATKFSGASLMADMLSCNYEGDVEDFGIVNYWISGNLRNCRFNNITYQCLGNKPQSCKLICEE